MKSSITKLIVFISLFILTGINSIKAQELSLGTDIVSRYIWRGFDLGANAPSIQPDVNLSIGGFTAGFWGAYSLSNFTALDEVDFYASYSFDIAESGSLSLGFTDYMNPNSGVRLGNFNSHDDPAGAGAHYIELNAGYTGPESFPLSFSVNIFLHNVANNCTYFQLGYDTSVQDVGLSLFVGATPGESSFYYGVDKFSVINTGFTVSKNIKITDSFSLPLFGSVILNPASENLFYVLGISL